MTDENPYIAPNADITTEDDSANYEPQIFSVNGRIGRLRYLAYGIGSSLIGMVLLFFIIGGSMLSMATSPENILGGLGLFGGLIYLAMIILSFIFMIRRLNDLDKTGWLSLLMIIPFVNLLLALYLIFGRGNSGANKYGPAPCENSMGVKVLALMFPVLFVVGIVVGIMGAATA